LLTLLQELLLENEAVSVQKYNHVGLAMLQ
jgi:hypothetical protein